MDVFTGIIWVSGFLVGLGLVVAGAAASFWYWTR